MKEKESMRPKRKNPRAAGLAQAARYGAEGKPAKAEKLYRRRLSIQQTEEAEEKAVGENHADAGVRLNDLAEACPLRESIAAPSRSIGSRSRPSRRRKDPGTPTWPTCWEISRRTTWPKVTTRRLSSWPAART